MSNPYLTYFQSQVGKPLDSPSPLGSWLQGSVVSVTHEDLTLSFLIRKEMTNPLGILHGGAAAAIIDDVIGMTVFILNKEYVCVTVSLTIDFLDNAREGETIYAHAKVIRNGKTLVNVECKLQNHEGKLLAKATSNLVATKIPMQQPG